MSDTLLAGPAPALLHSLKKLYEHFPHSQGLVIALSGGLDSMVLLDMCCELQPEWIAMFPQGMRAIHVHHGLSVNADRWLDFCKQQCDARAIHCVSVKAGAILQRYLAAGDSVEEAARRARYQVFERELAHDEVLLTAHHKNDQTETVLLNLLRGSGARGLAGMPVSRTLGQGQVWRPLLQQGRADLEAYAQRRALLWIDDESNQDIRLSRNFLRHQVLPLLATQWPGVQDTLLRTAALLADSDQLLSQLAEQYLSQHHDVEENTLQVADLLVASPAMQRLVLRHWLHNASRGDAAAGLWPEWKLVQTLIDEVVLATADAEPLLHWQGREIRRFRDRLYMMWPAEPMPPAPIDGLLWRQTPDGRLPVMVLPGNNGSLRLLQSKEAGMVFPAGECRVRYRSADGLECALAGRPRRALKKILQESDVPPWIRARTPLLFIDDQLAWIAGVGVCEGFQADKGSSGWAVNWQMPVNEAPEH
ncbi:tRNA lysidine(34) synthetase TilS [Gammaproteobacteria bacterium LSUCC0112]|nr:tRNA lysidine(34) synthetase TilS [Gammaproteobacteria bacterium LSUCC0112]